GHHADNVLAAVGGNPAYVGIKAPNTLQHRYLLEDVPTGLIPLIELGNAAGLALPTLRSIVNLSRAKLGGEAWQRPRALHALGLAGLATDAIRTFVKKLEIKSTGKPQRACGIPGGERYPAGSLALACGLGRTV